MASITITDADPHWSAVLSLLLGAVAPTVSSGGPDARVAPTAASPKPAAVPPALSLVASPESSPRAVPKPGGRAGPKLAPSLLSPPAESAAAPAPPPVVLAPPTEGAPAEAAQLAVASVGAPVAQAPAAALPRLARPGRKPGTGTAVGISTAPLVSADEMAASSGPPPTFTLDPNLLQHAGF